MVDRNKLAFLSQTRTILRLPLRSGLGSPRSVSGHAFTAEELLRNGRDGDGVGDGQPQSARPERSFLKAKTNQVTRFGSLPYSARSVPDTVAATVSSSITTRERRAFETVLRFTPNNNKTDSRDIKPRSSLFDAMDTDVENILEIFSTSINHHGAKRDAVPSQNLDEANALQENDKPQRIVETMESSRESLASDSPSPIAHHSSTLNASNLDQGSIDDVEKTLRLGSLDEDIQKAVREKMGEISTVLQSASTSTTVRGDIALWQACETHIFSLASHFPAPPPTESRSTPTPTPTVSVPQGAEECSRLSSTAVPWKVNPAARPGPGVPVDAMTGVSPQQPGVGSKSSSIMDPSVLHCVYPATLLLALRLFINEFPSSPFVHNLLPRMHSLGHTSSALGASPQFYNGLMSLVWLTQSSLRDIDALLSEMDRGGIEANEETLGILRSIEDARATDLSSASIEKGSRGAAWWMSHEQRFWFPRILKWLAVVAQRLATREN